MTRVLSGIQPTGEIHLGNYLGALRHWPARQADSECLYLLAGLHAITTPQDPSDLSGRTLATAAILLAMGIDPTRSVLFIQSHVGQHAELAWVLSCITNFDELQRMTQFKDRRVRQVSAGATLGLFAYPVLQAADILLYQADRIPVGEDQKQHIELTRDLAQRFNSRFGQTFEVPEPLIEPSGARIMDLQDPQKKMSKSSKSPKGVIRLTDTPDAIRTKVRAAVTDAGREIRKSVGRPAINNLLTIYSISSGISVPEAEEVFAGKGYAQFKEALADKLVEYLRPIRERYEEIKSEPNEICRILRNGADTARTIAAETLATVYNRVGFVPYR